MTRHIAILLCAGYGTRMGALTAETPKPLLPVAGKPILDYLVELLLELDGLDAIHLVSNSRYLEKFRRWADGWGRRIGPPGPRLVVHDDGSADNASRRGAVGDLDFLLRRVAPPAGALVAAGDNIYRFSLRPLWRTFVDSGHSYVLGLEERDPGKLRRTGVLELTCENRVLRLHEKPEQPPSTWACPSLYCLQASALARVRGYLDAGHCHDEIGRLIGHLVSREPIFAFEAEGERFHVGSADSYRRTDKLLSAM